MMVLLMGFIFVVSVHPLVMISFLIVMTLVCSVSMMFMLGGFWFSYLLVMVMVSGILVVFMYMVSFIPNESYDLVGGVVVLMMTVMMMGKGWFIEMGGVNSMLSVGLWESMVFIVNLLMIVFLLLIMLMVVSISVVKLGPVRME